MTQNLALYILAPNGGHFLISPVVLSKDVSAGLVHQCHINNSQDKDYTVVTSYSPIHMQLLTPAMAAFGIVERLKAFIHLCP